MPRIQQEDLEVHEEELGHGFFTAVYTAYVRLPSGHWKEVACKELAVPYGGAEKDMMREARVLQALSGVEGIPRLYGVTSFPPISIVMSVCPGKSITVFRSRQEYRTYLTALLQLCQIVMNIHNRNITHGDIREANILVEPTDVHLKPLVSLVEFDAAREATRENRERDAAQIYNLAMSVAFEFNPHSDSELYTRRKFIFSCMNDRMNVLEVTAVLVTVLHQL